MDRFWQIRNINEEEGELILYGNIASKKSWWDESNEGIYPRQFADDLRSLGNIKNLTVRLNSNGGDVFAATAIYTQLKAHQSNVTVIIDGVAASAATIIMSAADTVKAPSNALIMVHNPLFVLYGYYNTEDLSKMSGVLETVKDSILNSYVNKTSRDRKELSDMMDKETWLTAEEAKEQGFVDEIMFEESIEASFTNDNKFLVVNSVAHDMSKFQTRPAITPVPVAKKPDIPVIPLVATTKKKGDETVEIKNIEELKATYPELCNQLVAEASESERKRIEEIDSVSASIDPDLLNKAKYIEPMDAAQLALAAIKADSSKGKQYLSSREKEIEEAQGVQASNLPQEEKDDKKQEENAINLIAASANAKRGRELNVHE
ncbi:head maturation protease, ClpP-related [Brevibacillus laterosporus]|uniref:head maturation protease, ClpP-related n=1 Tax=Brevibacillus laterosporus TaxID=1465 RepID=UPI003D2635E4